MRKRPWLALIGLWLSLAAAGCADTGTGQANDKRGGLYGGITGGGTRP